MNAIVICCGGLRVDYIGCYGSVHVDTPHLDRLASEGFAFDQCFADGPASTAARRAWWTARHQFLNPAAGTPSPEPANLVRELAARGVRTALIRDSLAAADCGQPDSAAFGEIIEVGAPLDDLSGVFAAAREWIEGRSDDAIYLLFLDCHGTHPPWPEFEESTSDAAAFDEAADDPGEPPVERGTEANAEAAAHRRRYADVVAAWDALLGEFLDFLRGSGVWNETLLLVTADVGVTLGERDGDTPGLADLHEERIHVPLVVHLPGLEPGGRSRALVQAVDLMPTVFDALGVPPRQTHGRSTIPIISGAQPRIRDHLCLGTSGQAWAIRTPLWYFIMPAPGAASAEPALYVKPDDRWERNNVARQFPEIVNQLEQQIRTYVEGLDLPLGPAEA